MTRATRFRLLMVLASVVLLGVLLVAVATVRRTIGSATPKPADTSQIAAPGKLWAAPAFSLTDQAGQTLTNQDLLGKVWVADFFFTHCPGICIMLSANMRDLHEELSRRPDQGGVQLISFSLDPARDTPEVLREYAQALDAEPDTWAFLRGSQEEIWQLSETGFRLSVSASGDQANPIAHTGNLVLVDQQGVIRGFYDGLTPQGLAELRQDIAKLTP